MADAGREAVAKQIFTLTMAPEEYAARFAHTIVCSSFDDFQYSDPHLDEWIQRLHKILRTPGSVEECRKRFLTQEEIDSLPGESDEI